MTYRVLTKNNRTVFAGTKADCKTYFRDNGGFSLDWRVSEIPVSVAEQRLRFELAGVAQEMASHANSLSTYADNLHAQLNRMLAD